MLWLLNNFLGIIIRFCGEWAGLNPPQNSLAKVAELVDALDLGSCGVTRESSSLSFRTICFGAGDSPVR